MRNLFEDRGQETRRKAAPLAARMRPRTFGEFVGQEHVVGLSRVLRKSIEADEVPSIILWGPPGSGKTTLAHIIANMTSSHFEAISAVTSGVAELRKVIEMSRERFGLYRQRTILFVDEIHRFNKAQQDVILPHVEEGTVTFIGATTENPSFEIIAPLLSRSRVFTLKALGDEEVAVIIRQALTDDERGIYSLGVKIAEDAFNHLVSVTNGDARMALNALELAATVANLSEERIVSLDIVEDAIQQRSVLYDKEGDQHYDTISAFIKSVRGSDPDAAMYWLVRMIEAGEDPMFIARRLIILSAEDIGMADPRALTIAVASQQAVHFIGMPEGAIPLAEATVYMATAPKSNSAYVALNQAREDIRNTRNESIPMHLRNPVTSLMREQGYGKGYMYPHDYHGHFIPTENVPKTLSGKRYYHPSNQGYEVTVSRRLQEWWTGHKDNYRLAEDKPTDPNLLP